jgi:hypothetical protein
MNYSTVKKDFNFLYGLDGGGNYARMGDSIFDLMSSPTKEKAKHLYLTAIKIWFDSLEGSTNCLGEVAMVHVKNEKVIAIGRKYAHLD